MQRRYLLIAGAALVILLLVTATVTLVLPTMNKGAGAPQASTQGGLKSEPGDTVVTLTWSRVPGAAGYSIYRNDGIVPLNPTPVTDTQYQDIGLSNGRTYTYTVAPVDASGKQGERMPGVRVSPRSK